MSAVIALRTFKPGEMFNVSTGQTLPGGREVFLDPEISGSDHDTSHALTRGLPLRWIHAVECMGTFLALCTLQLAQVFSVGAAKLPIDVTQSAAV
ncbi:hypothetical protein AOA59_29505 [Pseudomonas sp. 2822-15]|nr:hypothetical protein AOA59_29505 [Pseudomonas sp. 2822-15]